MTGAQPVCMLDIMDFRVELEQEDDGRWLAEVINIPGALKYGATPTEAAAHAVALALRVLADRLEHGELPGDAHSVGDGFSPSFAPMSA